MVTLEANFSMCYNGRWHLYFTSTFLQCHTTSHLSLCWRWRLKSENSQARIGIKTSYMVSVTITYKYDKKGFFSFSVWYNENIQYIFQCMAASLEANSIISFLFTLCKQQVALRVKVFIKTISNLGIIKGSKPCHQKIVINIQKGNTLLSSEGMNQNLKAFFFHTRCNPEANPNIHTTNIDGSIVGWWIKERTPSQQKTASRV